MKVNAFKIYNIMIYLLKILQRNKETITLLLELFEKGIDK